MENLQAHIVIQLSLQAIVDSVLSICPNKNRLGDRRARASAREGKGDMVIEIPKDSTSLTSITDGWKVQSTPIRVILSPFEN